MIPIILRLYNLPHKKNRKVLSSSNRIDILSKDINELRNNEFDKVTSKSLQLNKTQLMMN